MLSIEYFKHFCNLQKVGVKNYTIFNNLGHDKNILLQNISDILNGNLNELNKIQFDNNIESFSSEKDIENFHDIIISEINKKAKNFNINIDNMIKNNTYTNKLFISEYNTYIKNINGLKKMCFNAMKYLKTDKNKNVIHIYSSYIFYLNVINIQYMTKNGNKFLYEVFIEYWDKSIPEFFTLMKISNYFNAFSNNVKHKEVYFNCNIENIMKNCIDIKDNIYIDEIIKLINDNILLLNSKKNNEEEKKLLLSTIIDYIMFGNRVCDSSQFMQKYLDNLIERLNINANYEIENELIKALNSSNNKSLSFKMQMCIDDLKNSNILTENILNIPEENIRFTSEKYKNFNKNLVNKCKYNLYRSFVWGDKNNYGDVSLPIEFQFYTDIVNFMCKVQDGGKSFQHRKFFIDTEKSKVNFDMEIGGINYEFKSTLLQASILKYIIMHEKLSAKSLAEMLNIKQLKFLSITLNSLISIGLIVRPVDMLANDINLTFSLNKKWKNEKTSIDLIEHLNDIKNMTKPLSDQEKTELKAKLIKHISEKKNTFDALLKVINSNKLQLQIILDELVKSNIIKKTEDQYFCDMDNSDSEND